MDGPRPPLLIVAHHRRRLVEFVQRLVELRELPLELVALFGARIILQRFDELLLSREQFGNGCHRLASP